MKDLPRRIIDLGFHMARLEPSTEDNTPILTIMCPATEDEAAASMQITGWEALRDFGEFVSEYCYLYGREGGEDPLDPPPDL